MPSSCRNFVVSIYRNMNSENKTVLITGVSSGIGYALTKKFLNENYRVIGTTRSGKLDHFQHPNLSIVALEATSQESLWLATQHIKKLTQKVNILINNAGIAPDVFNVIPEYEVFTQTLNTNVTGVVFFTESVLDFIENDAKIIFITSNMGITENAEPHGTGYRLSKAAINMYTAILAKRLAEKNIMVSGVHPGWVQTKMGGDQAPLTADQAANGIYNSMALHKETGKIWDITLPGIIK